jgi:hypothetical protein
MQQLSQTSGAKAPVTIVETLVLATHLQKETNDKLQLIIDHLPPRGAVETALGQSAEHLREAASALQKIDQTLESGELTVKVRIDDCSEEVRDLLRPFAHEARAGGEARGGEEGPAGHFRRQEQAQAR